MSKISCEVCLDLLPLVKDNVASQDSIHLVEEHIMECEECRTLYESDGITGSFAIDDQKIIKKIKHGMYIVSILALLIGSIFGVWLSDGMGMFYNIAIMPFIGAASYFVFHKKWYMVSAVIFILSMLRIGIGYVLDGVFTLEHIRESFTAALYFSVIYVVLSAIGVLIAVLLEFAFKREGKNV